MTPTRQTVIAGVLAILCCAGCGDGGTGPSTPIPQDPEPPPGQEIQCEPFESTWAAIHELVLERPGCTAEACHGSSASGGLDLRADVAVENLIDAPSSSSAFSRITPKDPLRSYLFLKLAAATDPSLLAGQAIAGRPMPFSGAPLSKDRLAALRIWIEAGAPTAGAVTGNAGLGSDHVGKLLGACLPEAAPVEVVPLATPAAGEGVQLVMPPHRIAAGSEVELCFASYFDFSGQIPERFLDETGDYYFVKREERREDPNTHHIIVMKPTVDLSRIDDPSFGEWVCADGPRRDQPCDPLAPADCPDSLCRSAIVEQTACFGFGPSEGRPNGAVNFDETYLIPDLDTPGFFVRQAVRGLVYWNSHAFNLTSKDTMHHVYRNFYFTDDLRFEMSHFNHFEAIGAATGIPPFEKRTVCSTRTFSREEEILYLASHTHKRGEFFWVEDPSGEVIYESPFYDDPLFKSYDPPLRYDSQDEEERTLTYCAVFNNGVNADGSPNLQTVTRLSRKPARSTCEPVACAEGRTGAPCAGPGDHATCDSEAGRGDGLCDACSISGGQTTDDEMFVLLGGTAVYRE